ncbi:MAG: DedA family protein, partial [Chloroflexi bacterium]|nr:DedA family protein [Chloroflexota bacterium]
METLFSFLRDMMLTIRHGGWPELGIWSYVLLAVLVATEGPITTLIGAAAAAAGYLDIWYVLLAAATGNVLGDTLWYTVGYISKIQTIYRYGNWLGLRNHHVERIELEMQSHAAKLIILSKISYGLIVPTLVAAGLARVPWRKWFPAVLAAEMIWTITLVAIGFHAAGAISRVGHSLQIIGIAVFVLVMITIFWYVRRIFRRSAHEDDLPETLVVEEKPQVTNTELTNPDYPQNGAHKASTISKRVPSTTHGSTNGQTPEPDVRKDNFRKDNFQVFPATASHPLSGELERVLTVPS